jgi:adenosylcobinamide-GDP ribazoletransferase
MRILKDSRVGAFGACAVVLSIAGRAALLARLGPQAAWALPLVGAAARVGPVWQIALLPYVATSASRSRGVAAAGPTQALVATGWALAIAAALVTCPQLGGWAAGGACVGAARAVAMMAAMSAVTLFTGWRYARRLGGMTGDFAGATEQVCELAGLAALAWGAS